MQEYFNKFKEKGQIELITFHQSYGYEEFIEGIKPIIDGNSKEITYKVQDGVFKRFCDRAAKTKEYLNLDLLWENFVDDLDNRLKKVKNYE